MRKPLLLLLVLAVLFPPAAGSAGTWVLDTAHTGIHFKVRHLMVSWVRGDFERFSGTIVYDEKDVTNSSADITIEAASINTRIAKRDKHLISPDFLDAAAHPVLTFRSKRVEKAPDGTLKMTGDLTIRGVTREVVLTVEGPSPAVKDLEGKMRVGGTATAKIDRKVFGLTWNKAIEAGGVVVGDEVFIIIEVELVRNA
ncbi:MAG: YceI family protein [Deltaproteobacteria bacterium]